jgi:hypothetical protein
MVAADEQVVNQDFAMVMAWQVKAKLVAPLVVQLVVKQALQYQIVIDVWQQKELLVTLMVLNVEPVLVAPWLQIFANVVFARFPQLVLFQTQVVTNALPSILLPEKGTTLGINLPSTGATMVLQQLTQRLSENYWDLVNVTGAMGLQMLVGPEKLIVVQILRQYQHHPK